jgi:hypothetical protein
MLIVPFLAEGIANVWYIDGDLEFMSFAGAILAMVGTFKINKGHRLRRQLIFEETLKQELEEEKRQIELHLLDSQRKLKETLGVIVEDEEIEYEKEKAEEKARVEEEYMQKLL